MGMFLLKLLEWFLVAIVAVISVLLKIFTFFKEAVKENVKTLENNSERANQAKSNKSQKSVKRNIAPLWVERNWKKHNNTYNGYYRTKFGSYRGEIIERFQGLIQFYIYSPPNCLARHSHYQCFIPKEGNKYEIHFSRKARTLDEGIMSIEKILAEAHKL